MKVLVTGKEGAFSKLFRHYIESSRNNWETTSISLRDDVWKRESFSEYDSIFHTVGISNSGDKKMIWYVNVELSEELAKKAASEDVKHFIYLSSMAVYDGIKWGFGREGFISYDTEPCQSTEYGKSKYAAENSITNILGNKSNLAIVRAPSIVGGGMENYFKRYYQFANIPFVPIPWTHTEAKRSFIYCDTLAEFICNIIEEKGTGYYYPQQLPQLSAAEMINEVCKAVGKKKHHSEIIGNILPDKIKTKYASQICYDPSLDSEENNKAMLISSYEAIEKTIRGIL